jgi:hypothetical protein
VKKTMLCAGSRILAAAVAIASVVSMSVLIGGCANKQAAPPQAGVVINDLNSPMVNPKARAEAEAAEQMAQRMKPPAQSAATPNAGQSK